MSELVPITRTLPAVLRDALENEGVRLVVAKVISIPDNAHVRVEIAGTQVTIPRLASYQAPVAGDAAYCLATGAVMIAVGIATPTPRGGAAVDPGTATGQVPVWNAATGRWTGQAKAPDADALDGIDSSGFVRAFNAFARSWLGVMSGTTDGLGQIGIFHGLGVKPTVALATLIDSSVLVLNWKRGSSDASWVLFQAAHSGDQSIAASWGVTASIWLAA